MKIMYRGYEVEIKAKSTYRPNSKYNSSDTEAVILDMICALNDAAFFNAGQGWENIAEAQRNTSNQLRNALNK